MNTVELIENQAQQSYIVCPVCGNHCSEPPLYKYSVSEAAAHFCPSTRNFDRNQRLEKSIRKLWKGDECSVIRCNKCSFGFGYPFVGGDEEFYEILHEQFGYPRWRWDYDIAIQNMNKSQSKGRILDIGAGTGCFLKALDSEYETYAVEGSDTTREKLEKLSIRVFPSLPELVATEAGTFSAITMFQVLEHIADFHQVLDLCRQLLIPGGLLFITVPNWDAMILQEQLTGCTDMPPNHINKWTPDSLSLALTNANFQPELPIFEPETWKNLLYFTQLKLMVKSAKEPDSLVARVYQISNKKIRVPLLGILGIPTCFGLLSNYQQVRQGQTFAMLGVAR
jgi:SAM-dependent methyltransferase